MRLVPGVRHWIGYLPEAAKDYFRLLAPDMELILQRGTSLGERLDHLLSDALGEGSRRAVVIGSDSPTLPSAYIAEAFERLNEVDVILGPTEDGGYYLIGVKRPQPQLLRQVQMSTPHVLSNTLALAEAAGLTVAQLPTWFDVDKLADLLRLDHQIAGLEDSLAVATRRWLRANQKAFRE